MSDEKQLKIMTCPQCKKDFKLTWNDYSYYDPETKKHLPQTLIIRGCPSGGIYDVSIECPYCDYEEPL